MANYHEKTERYLQSAGISFFVNRVEEILLNIEKLKIKEEKIKLIEKYFENQEGYSDKDIKGTRIRVNSTIKIIKENNIEYVLNKIIESKKVPLNTVTKARKILEQQFKK
ncbi:TPA: hypothetical protein CPT96_08035 [Candidatus Gastranaerophilales bacterium HUM_10]|nr:MAG TPA: hypothetical protein CPT96_08035 [Candidatus Gastranaerophilales bacterium HUM_10]